MKNMNQFLSFGKVLPILLLLAFTSNAQNKRVSITVLNIDTKGIQLDPQQMGNITRIELEKLDTFDVTDRYDVAYIIEKNKLNITNCYGKMCLLEVGNTIKSDYMFTGSAELYAQTIVITFRLINVQKGSIEKTTVIEFLNLPLEIQGMSRIAIRKMFGKENDETQLIRLTQKFNYENSTNNPDKERLNLQGPRFGYSYIFGNDATVLGLSRDNGGYEVHPAMFQFGYQFEKQYLNEGNYQALFEFIPMITGIDQQMIMPSVTFLNGFRNNKNGWEIAIGPAIGFGSYADVATINGVSYTQDYINNNPSPIFKDVKTAKRLDSRGNTELVSALVVAIGKTFKSGKMNIPVNAYFTIPTKDGFRVGISIGYNSKK
jgi:hypothetical protein